MVRAEAGSFLTWGEKQFPMKGHACRQWRH